MTSNLCTTPSLCNIRVICSFPRLVIWDIGMLYWIGGAVWARSRLPESAFLLPAKELLGAAHHVAVRIGQRRLAQNLYGHI